MSSRQRVEAAVAVSSKRLDGLRLARVTDEQAKMIREMGSENLIAGGNRGGKSFLIALVMASIARDEPILTMSGDKINCRMRHQQGRPLLIWCFGDHLSHIGRVIHRLLFRAGMFWIIKDKHTGGWRAWNPVRFPEDWDREDERKPSPPLIPDSMVKEKAWYEKQPKWFKSHTLGNGTEIQAFASSQDDPQGSAVDIIWIDEHLVRDETYDELLMRLRDKRGRSFWSTIPRPSSAAYMSLEERAELQEDEVDRGLRDPKDHYTKHFTLSLLDNPFIHESEKKKALEQIDDIRQSIRIYGETNTNQLRVYQEYDERVHCVEYRTDAENDAITEVMRQRNWSPPPDWTVELILDPGTQRPAILFGAVPPESFWDHGEPYFIVFDEIYPGRMDAYELAQRAHQQLNYHGVRLERMIIDGQAARQTPMLFSKSVGDQATEAFMSKGVKSRQTGHYFIPGDPNFITRSQRVHTAMRLRECGRPQLRIVTHKCPGLVKQLKTNTRKVGPDGYPLEVPRDRLKDDCRVCLEYWLSRFPIHVPRDVSAEAAPPGVQRVRNRRAARALQAAEKPQDNSVAIGAIA
jgi:hypothetical protein